MRSQQKKRKEGSGSGRLPSFFIHPVLLSSYNRLFKKNFLVQI